MKYPVNSIVTTSHPKSAVTCYNAIRINSGFAHIRHNGGVAYRMSINRSFNIDETLIVNDLTSDETVRTPVGLRL